MPLWTDIVDPVEATAVARVSLAEYELQWGSLARYLPNVPTGGNYVEFFVDGDQLVDEARYRAYNAPPETTGGGGGGSKLIKLPAMSGNEPIDEKTQLALKNLPDDRIRKSILAAIRRRVFATADRNERTRGVLIETGNVTVVQGNFTINDVFGRDAALTVNAGAGNYWTDAAVDRLAQLNTWVDLYSSKNNGRRPGSILIDPTLFNAFARGNQFATLLANGATRPGLQEEVRALAASAGLPPFDLYGRSTKSGKVLSVKKIYLLPEPGPVESDEAGYLGATYYGESLMADADGFEGIDGEPGMVVGVYKEDRIPFTVEVQSDAITEPVAHNANGSMAIQVLA